MIKIEIKILICILLSSFFLSCASSGIQNTKKIEHYKPQKLDELEIANFLLGYQKAWNAHDKDKVLGKYLKDAKIFPANSNNEMSLNEFSVKLPKMFENMPILSFGMPSINFLAFGICNSDKGTQACVQKASVSITILENKKQYSFILKRQKYYSKRDGSDWIIEEERQ